MVKSAEASFRRYRRKLQKDRSKESAVQTAKEIGVAHTTVT
jgi:hypothetical protein